MSGHSERVALSSIQQWHIKTRVSPDVRFDVRLWIVCQQAGGVWCVTGPSSHVTNCHELSWLSHSSLHQWTIFRVTGAEDSSIAHCSSYVLFSFRVVYYSVAAIIMRGEGSSHSGGIMSLTLCVTDLFSIEHSARSRYMGSDLLSQGWSGPILSNPEWSQEIVGPSHSGSSTKNQHKTPSKRI